MSRGGSSGEFGCQSQALDQQVSNVGLCTRDSAAPGIILYIMRDRPCIHKYLWTESYCIAYTARGYFNLHFKYKSISPTSIWATVMLPGEVQD